ncbi:MAG: redoxin domain-containing protein [Acidobacteriota bacterium]|nr:redoxin domain-containing protein [Acidobacteriota bacterium]MDQ3547298.1 redoxin domain-containing protein [Chloroflexota bacterium]
MPTIEYDTTRTRSRRDWLSTLALIGALLFAGAVGWVTRPWADEPDTTFGMSGAAEDAPRPGELAPDFRLKRADGSILHLADLRGQPVFLNFWATWCTFCLEEMPDMQRIAEQFDGQLVVLGVNAGDSVASGSGFAERIGANYELVYDTEQGVVAGYRVRSMPSSYFIDADGRIVDAHLGFLTWDDMLAKVTALLEQGSARP